MLDDEVISLRCIMRCNSKIWKSCSRLDSGGFQYEVQKKRSLESAIAMNLGSIEPQVGADVVEEISAHIGADCITCSAIHN